MRKALITGGLGFIGSYITRQLLDQGHVEQAVLLDHYGGYIDPTRTDFVDYRKKRLEGYEENIIIERGEARYYNVLHSIINKHRPDYIIHLSALPLAKINNLNAQEALEGSVASTTHFFEVIGSLPDYQPKRFIYTSSSMVYGDFQSAEATEEHPKLPKEIYGTMKLAGEIVTRGLGQYYNVPWTIIRPSAVYGPTDMNRRVSQIFIEKAFKGEELNINGADEKLDFTYVKDIANGFVLAATHEGAIGETFNITHGKAHTLVDFVECLRKHFPKMQTRITERDAFRPQRGTLSIEKAKARIGYEPQYGLQDGIDEYVAFIKANRPELTDVC